MKSDNTKPVLILAGAIAALFAISFAVRFVALSQLGLPGGWMLMFAVPAGGIGLLLLLLRLGLLTSTSHGFSAVAPVAAPVPTTAQRLQEIEHLHDGGAMSEDEYNAERARIIASI